MVTYSDWRALTDTLMVTFGDMVAFKPQTRNSCLECNIDTTSTSSLPSWLFFRASSFELITYVRLASISAINVANIISDKVLIQYQRLIFYVFHHPVSVL